MFKSAILVFLGGGLGSVCRYLISKALNSRGTNLPWGTFTVNILGSFIIGLLLGIAIKNNNLNNTTNLILATGFCGGFTTFSTFSFVDLVSTANTGTGAGLIEQPYHTTKSKVSTQNELFLYNLRFISRQENLS